MENILKLIKNEKVKWKRLGEVCEIKRGRVISKKFLSDKENIGIYPVYSSQTLNNGQIGSINTYDFDGDYITWTTDGAYAGTVFYREGKFSITNICGIISLKSSELILKFLYYYLSIEAKNHVAGGSGNPKLMSNVVHDILVPVPSLEVQEKIAKTLDKFTNYVTELLLRNKQYNYYRNFLLSDEYLTKKTLELCGEDVEVEYKIIADLCDIKKGEQLNKKQLNDDEMYPAYNGGKTFSGRTNKYNVEANTIIISQGGASAGYVNFITERFWANAHCYYLIPNQSVKNRFLYHFLKLKQDYLMAAQYGAGIPSLSKDTIWNIFISTPPLTVQNHIASILDQFDTLTNNLSEGLPKEIELRQKQYEYYRDQLLSFNEN
ncbi:restriction endonuclease subunit S [Ureaplasma diversum]|uniref:Type I restriction modification system specificity (S) subunit, HsdS n=1 Tax=Ureaplasma diversum NCTC 246 TaxID=1188241 RepID=A0A084EXY0_9BACT|nr:restriction endonuclease subunit S [Ureaplasma diversum]KEZ22822.1 Type I restriction modification system specificity (S) subunit, HsdS [Ureaplasma diversum NCTC 246]